MKVSLFKTAVLALIAVALSTMSAWAQAPFKIGIAAGLTGYAATVDTAWRDGVELAVAALNAKGGLLGRKVEVVVEDNHSEPQQAMTAYHKMISSDHVDVFVSGCVSAGNFAAAPMVVKAKIPMVLCSILPTQAGEVKWMFTTIPPPRFEVEKRLEYLRDNTQIKKFGVLHDPTPYSNLQNSVAEKEAGNYGLTMVTSEQYEQNDSDLSVQIAKINAAGGGAILKIGLGGSTLTAAKNIQQLGLPLLMLTSLEDVAVFRPVAQVMSDKFFFVASPSQVYDALPAGPLKTAIAEFLKPWRAKYGDRDPNWAARGWDAVALVSAAAKAANSTKGPAIRDALEKIEDFQGTTGIYNMSPENHYGLTKNPFFLAQIIDGKTRVVK